MSAVLEQEQVAKIDSDEERREIFEESKHEAHLRDLYELEYDEQYDEQYEDELLECEYQKFVEARVCGGL